MKLLSKITLPFLVLSSFSLVSCDSDTPVVFGGQSLSDLTEIDEFIEAGEILTFEETQFGVEFQNIDELEFDAQNSTFAGDIEYIYEQTGELNATLEANIDVEANLQAVPEQVINLANSSNNELISLLLVPDVAGDAPDLTDAEWARLIVLLNTAGAGLVVNPDDEDQLLVLPNILYTMTSEATVEDRLFGVVGGKYGMDATSQAVLWDIELFTDDENNTFRFYVPILSPEVFEAQIFEQGTYTLQLNNSLTPVE